MKILRNNYFLLVLIICTALLLRTINLKDNILFAYDQARDAQRIYNMIYKGDIKIVGPETDIPGIFNGPLLYYILAPIYFFTNFNPNAAAFFFVLINVATILLIYWGAKILFNKNSIALVSALLWTFSYEQGFFARYISNASPMSTTTTLFFIGLALFFIRNKQYGLPLSALGIALSIHCNFYFIYLFIFYPLFFILFKKKPSGRSLILSLLILGFLLSPWILTELKWRFVGTKSLITYFFHQGGGIISVNFVSFIWKVLLKYFDRISQAIFFSFIPSKSIGFLITFCMLAYSLIRKPTHSKVFLGIWILNTLPLFVFQSGVHSVEVINGSVFVPLTIFVAYIINELSHLKLKKIPIISIIVTLFILIYGFAMYIKNDFIPYRVFTYEPSLLLNSKKVIDYTYQKTDKKDFGICSISEPLFINTVWSFLYSTYGKQKYGYVPYWTGQKQIINDSFIPYATKKYSTKFIIREPMQGIPDYAPQATYYIEDTQNLLVDQQKYGSYFVQQRKFTHENSGEYRSKYTKEQIKKNDEIIRIEPRFSCDVIYE